MEGRGPIDPVRLPARLGPYVLLRELGEGAMGRVYLAEDHDEERRVALKVLHPHLVRRRGFFPRFQREALAGQRVVHPNVVRTHDCGFHVTDGVPYCVLVMEYVEGRTLRELLRDHTVLPEALVREIALQVVSGLAAIHEAGIVHRDLKPENVLITVDHRVRIMDLGVARHTDADIELTQAGQFTGSLLYAAPEQLRGPRVGPAADQYALGVMLYELACGTNPFRHDDPSTVMDAQLTVSPERLDCRAPEVSAFLSEVVATLLAKRAQDRFASAADLRAVLEAAESGPWWERRERATRRERERRPRVPVRRETGLYGREADLAAWRDAWEEAKSGRGRVLLLEGEPGIGKSRLVDAIFRELEDEDAHVLYGSYPPFGAGDGVLDAFRAKFGRADLELALRSYLTVTPTLIPAFAAILRRETPPPDADPLPGGALVAVCVHLLRALAQERPLVLVVEDLHFAGGDGRERILSLARAVEGHSILLVATARPGLPEGDRAALARLDHCRCRLLRRLSGEEVLPLLREALGNEVLAERLGPRIARHTDGVPFFLLELLRSLRDGGNIRQGPDGRWTAPDVIERLEVPPAVRDLIAARLTELKPGERAILDAGAVQGFAFDPELIAALLDRQLVALLQDLAEIERRCGAVRADGSGYRFDHHQIQEVVYDELAPRLAREYHALLAETHGRRAGPPWSGEDRVFLASHHLRGNRPRESLPHVLPALDHLEKSYRHELAIEIATRVLTLPGLVEGGERVELLLRKAGAHRLRGERDREHAALEEALAEARSSDDRMWYARVKDQLGEFHRLISDFATAERHFSEALDLAREAGDRPAEARVLSGLGSVVAALARHEEARALCEQCIALAHELGERKCEAIATGNLGTVYFYLGKLEEARVHYERHLALARQIGFRHGEAIATGNLGLVMSHLGRNEEARVLRERCLALSREIGDRRGEAMATGNLGHVYLNLGQAERARELFAKHLVLSREIGDRHGEATALGTLGRASMEVGRHEEARAFHEESLAIAREIGDRFSEASGLIDLGNCLVQIGRFEEARREYERCVALSREIRLPRGEARATGNLGVVSLHQGRYAQALAHFERQLALAREMGDRFTETTATGNLGRTWSDLGRLDVARTHLEAYRELARGAELPASEGEALEGLGRLAERRNDPETASRRYEAAVTLLRRTSNAAGLASALLALGQLEGCRGEVEQAVAHLDEAVALAHGMHSPVALVSSLVARARLPGGDPDAARRAFAEHEKHLRFGNEMEIRFRLWELGGDRAHLERAHGMLCFLRDHAPDDCRTSVIEQVPLHAHILHAWAEHGAPAA